MAQKNILQDALARCRDAFLWVGFFSLLINVLMLTVSIYMMQVYDRVLTGRSLSTLLYLTVIAIGALGIMSLLDMVRSRILVRTSVWLEQVLSPKVFGRAVENALAGHDYRSEGLRDLGNVRGFLGGGGIMSLFDAPWVPIYLALIYLLHPVLGHVAVAGAIILFALAVANDKATHKALMQANSAAGRCMRTADAAVRNAEVVDAMGLLRPLIGRWHTENAKVLQLQSDASDRAGIILSASKFVRLLLQVAVLGVGAYYVVHHEMSAGGMIAASIIMSRALAPVEQAISTWKQTLQALSAYDRLRNMFRRDALRPDAMPLPAPKGHLTVEQVTYAPPASKSPVLRNVSLEVRPGEAVAIVGPSAAGKSTLARLLVGSRQPQAGAVRLDGANLFGWNRDNVGPHIGYLPQDVELFAGTVSDNIARLGKPDPEAVVDAAQLAGVHDMILRLPDGYETQIGDFGAMLSGGQKQRIALARALYGRPKLIVLDEPNANLDSEGEEALNQAIQRMKEQGSAIVVIGHRSSILVHVDKLCVMQAGAVQMFGPRDEVMQRLNRGSNVVPVPTPRPAPQVKSAAE